MLTLTFQVPPSGALTFRTKAGKTIHCQTLAELAVKILEA